MILIDVANPNTKQLIGKSGIQLWIDEPGKPIKMQGTATDLETYSQALVTAVLIAVCQEISPSAEELACIMLRIKQELGEKV